MKIRLRAAAALLVVVGVLSGCKSMTPKESTKAAGDEVRVLITKNVADKAKAKQLIDLVEAAELDMQAFVKERAMINKKIVEKNTDYNATREDMQKLYDELNDRSKDMAMKLVQLHINMKKLATPEEWKKISGNKHRIGGF